MLRLLLSLRAIRMRLSMVLLGAGWTMAFGAGATTPMGPSPCLGPDSVTAQNLPILDSIANGVTVEMRATRDSLGLPVAQSMVRASLVTENAICAQAASAIDGIVGSLPSARRVYVYRLGKAYAVEDPTRLAGGWRQIAFFTSAFAYTASLAQ